MKVNDQIARALNCIAAHGGDLDLETELALKALAADYAAQGEEIKRLEADIIEGGMLRKRVGDDLAAAYEENETLTTELRRLELAHATDLGTIAKLQAEIERLQALYDDCSRCNGDLMKTAVSKGIEVDDIKADIARLVKRTEYADSAIRAAIYESQSGIRTPQEAIRKIGLILFGTGVEAPNVKRD